MSLCVPAGKWGLSLLPSLIFSFLFLSHFVYSSKSVTAWWHWLWHQKLADALPSSLFFWVQFTLNKLYLPDFTVIVLFFFLTKKALKMGKWNGWYNTQTVQHIMSSYHIVSIRLGSGMSIQFLHRDYKKIIWVKPTRSKMNYKFTNVDLNQKRK